MIGGNGIKKVSKKDVIGELVNIAEMTWKSYENYIKNKSNENLESFRFYFNYFYNTIKKWQKQIWLMVKCFHIHIFYI